jgi:hypothetical protein
MVSPCEFGGLTVEEIDHEVRERREMIGGMVGWLYPAILSGEIEELLRLRATARTRAGELAEGARRTDDNLRRVFG